MAIDKLGANALASDSVTSAKIAADAVVTADIDDDSITYPKTSFADSATGAQTLPKGTTAQRPSTPTAGDLRFNSTNTALEVYNGSGWVNVGDDTATITTAVPISEDLRQKIINYIKNQGNKQVELKEVVDENIVGGTIIRIGDKELDASVSTSISELRQTFNKNLYEQDF